MLKEIPTGKDNLLNVTESSFLLVEVLNDGDAPYGCIGCGFSLGFGVLSGVFLITRSDLRKV